SVMTPNPNRYDLLGRTIDEYKADGVLEMTLQACHTYNVEHKSIERFVTEEKKIPYFMVETDYSTADVAQLNTRIAAFIEMM
ncbi:MAG: 2-hydroxyacyl-CoA dehydratase, partial [Mogibacterium sp.]|nr:2-hydroxyacyl-CoA dehydratase [Mogibacterium sp.]